MVLTSIKSDHRFSQKWQLGCANEILGCTGGEPMQDMLVNVQYKESINNSITVSLLAFSCVYPICYSQVFSWEWKCSWSIADRRWPNYIWMSNKLIAYYSVAYIRDLMVVMEKGVNMGFHHHDDLAIDPLCNVVNWSPPLIKQLITSLSMMMA